MGESSDDDLVAATLAGDIEAFGVLVARHAGLVRAVTIGVLGAGHEGADDAMQETWLRAYRALGQYERRGKFAAWLRVVAGNAAASRRRRLAFAATVLDLLPERPDPRPGPDAEALRRELAEALAAALLALPPHQRDAVLLCDRDGLCYHEAGAALGVARATIATRVFRGRRRLRSQLGDA
jgi:RNA polymerase sigma factor (sigma-70 family)